MVRWLSGKESVWQYRRCGFDSWIGKVPWKRKWQPSVLAWKIPWTEKPGRLEFTGSQRDTTEHTHTEPQGK